MGHSAVSAERPVERLSSAAPPWTTGSERPGALPAGAGGSTGRSRSLSTPRRPAPT